MVPVLFFTGKFWTKVYTDYRSQCRTSRMDVTSKDSMELAFDKVIEDLGKVDNW